jgi:glycosyltransferase involved in cell wall biosynthesis
VTMLGWRDDVATVLAASDAVLLTSDNEGTPLSLIQAGMAGLPVVASDVGSISDVVIDGETGWLCTPNAPDLARATLALINDPAEAQRRGASAQNKSGDRYSVERMTKDHEALYQSIANTYRS